MDTVINVALSLSGGAARGAFHLGVIQSLRENGIKIRAIAGSSIGAVVGAGYACGHTPQEMLEFFKSKDFKRTIGLNIHRGSLWRIDTNKTIFDEFLNGKKSFDDLNLPLHVAVTDLSNGRVCYENRGDLINAITASCALMPFFKPVKIRENWCVDGGYMDNLPVKPLKKYELPIIGVNLHPLLNYSNGGLLKRALFLSWHASIAANLSELEYCITSPKLTKYSLFSLSKLDELYEHGYSEGKNCVTALQNICSQRYDDEQK